MAEQQIESGDVEFKDRRFGLVGWGIFHILLGALCLFLMVVMGLVMGLGAVMGKSHGATSVVEPRLMTPALLVYGALAAWSLTMGIGSLKCRRWARALIAAASWLFLVGGGMGLLFAVFLMPDMYGSMVKNGQMPESAARIMRVVMMGFMTVFYVVLPAGLLLFYSRRDCRATCEARDPQPRWTDGVPMPVLTVTLMFGLWAVSILLMGAYGWFFPFFGTILTGSAGMLAVLMASVLCAATAWGLGRLRSEAWAGALALTVAWSVSGYLTFRNMTMLDLYRKMNFPDDQLRVMGQMALPDMSSLMAMYGAGVVLLLGVLVYSRRYFHGAA